MDQPTFASVASEQQQRKTRRERFLERTDGLAAWAEPESRIPPCYPEAGRGRPPDGVPAIRRIHGLQLCDNLSD